MDDDDEPEEEDEELADETTTRKRRKKRRRLVREDDEDDNLDEDDLDLVLENTGGAERPRAVRYKSHNWLYWTPTDFSRTTLHVSDAAHNRILFSVTMKMT